MKWNQFPALRVLIFYLLFYFLFSYVNWIGSVIGVLVLLFLWFLKIIQVKVCFLLIGFQLLIMGRLSIDEYVKLPDNHYLVERVLKDNEYNIKKSPIEAFFCLHLFTIIENK